MIDVPISIVAWITVVLIQAIIHYVVLGARRARIQQEDDLVLEETLSLTTTEGSMDVGDETDTFTLPDSGYQGTIISSTPGTPTLLVEKCLVDINEPDKFMELLAQTGTDLLKSRSVECMVEEQMRARAQ